MVNDFSGANSTPIPLASSVTRAAWFSSAMPCWLPGWECWGAPYGKARCTYLYLQCVAKGLMKVPAVCPSRKLKADTPSDHVRSRRSCAVEQIRYQSHLEHECTESSKQRGSGLLALVLPGVGLLTIICRTVSWSFASQPLSSSCRLVKLQKHRPESTHRSAAAVAVADKPKAEAGAEAVSVGSLFAVAVSQELEQSSHVYTIYTASWRSVR